MSKYADRVKDKVFRSVTDSFLNPLLDWIEEYLKENIPITLDALKAKALELFNTTIENNPEESEIVFDYVDAFLGGVAQGERRKELAMIEGMKNAGMSPMQIQLVMLQAQEALVRMGTDDLKITQPTVKESKKRKRSR